jgi:hypothetical protein
VGTEVCIVWDRVARGQIGMQESAELLRRRAVGLRGSHHPPSRMSTAKRTATVQVFNEVHGLIVGAGKSFCKKSQPQCERRPLQKFLPDAQ